MREAVSRFRGADRDRPTGRRPEGLGTPHLRGGGGEGGDPARPRSIPEEIDDVIFGNALAGGGNVARLTALQAGLSLEVPGVTIDRQCGSGMNAVALAALAVQGGAGEIFVAGGTESMTRAPSCWSPRRSPLTAIPPRFVRRLCFRSVSAIPRWGSRRKPGGEIRITREEQDRYALASQRRIRGRWRGFSGADRSPDDPRETGDPLLFDTDEHPRPEHPWKF